MPAGAVDGKKKAPVQSSHQPSSSVSTIGTSSDRPKTASSQSSIGSGGSSNKIFDVGARFRPKTVPDGWHYDDAMLTPWPNGQWEKLQRLIESHHDKNMRIYPVLGFISQRGSPTTMVFYGDDPSKSYGSAFYVQEGGIPLMYHPITPSIFQAAFRPQTGINDPPFIPAPECHVPGAKPNDPQVKKEIEIDLPEWW